MQLSKHDFYILVEGHPNSPELAFFTQAIQKIVDLNGLSSIYPNIVEVGSSSSFNAFAQLGYRHSKIHQSIPVLAIGDSDYRTSLNKQSAPHQQFIAEKKPKILYWARHEWENYLLEETDFLASWINQIPMKANHLPKTTKKFYRKSDKQADKLILDDGLKKYFQNSIKVEYWECLKFNLAVQIKKYPTVAKPADFESQTVTEIKAWFLNQTSKSEAVVKLKKRSDRLFDEIMTELPWETWLTQPLTIQFELAKKRFRGKEAFYHLCQFLQQAFGIHNLDKDALIRETLKHLTTNTSSAIFRDLQDLLLPELISCRNST
ncbi:hypothetical protein THIOM_004307 [Candidatus Thiomargarita nelsonii]|uniref:DUF4435 domain-containing protein n=1 Tax=Candidatus Thiomargarita nelsonii TaxID=1003181 RepID=A0A0A6NXR6_9GAMM|nr:hypothetical protein THIOM_004307 [Candidatus Thiomargarita nelsonii]